MTVQPTHVQIAMHEDKALVIGVWEGEKLSGLAAEVDQIVDGALGRLVSDGDVSTKPTDVTRLLGLAGFPRPIFVVGCGERDKAEPSLAFRTAGSAAKQLAEHQVEAALFCLDVQPLPAAVCGSLVGGQGQALAQAEPKLKPCKQIYWATENEAAVKEGAVLGECVNDTRRLVNLPANQLPPTALAEECQRLCRESGIEVEVWDEAHLNRERCNALLAVGQGSACESRLVIMRYEGADKDAPRLGLVGKGVTFDSGGLSLKPGAAMIDMRMDMAGAATVCGAMQAMARLQVPVNVVGVVGLVENMVSNRCFRPGDVLTARSGKTIEVRNTDAEGRLVLADAVDVAIKQGVDHLVDLATLTGSCMAALGLNTVGVMANDDAWSKQVMAAAASAGERVWQLPMFEEFGEQIKSDVADIKNVGEGRWGGAMTAAKFIEEFVGDTPWVHLDIAGPAFSEKPKAWIDAGASGCMVRTLVELGRVCSR